jgi:peptidoglycan hydrolase-like protein with peptidoglycan-binding domain
VLRAGFSHDLLIKRERSSLIIKLKIHMKKLFVSSIVALALVLGSANANAYTFASYLTIGSTGADVVALQTWLVSKGFLTMPAGVAMGYFGQLTKAAVAAYQASAGLPSTGFVGPLTIAKLNGAPVAGGGSSTACPAGFTCTAIGGGSTSSASGEEGELNSFDNIGGVESSVDEGQTERVLGVEFDAEDSEMTIERVDVDFTVGSGGSSNLDDYIESVALVLDGKNIAEQDVDEADEDDDVFSFRFTGLDGMVGEDDTAELYVEVTAVNNLDSGDSDVDLTVDIPLNGIRATDGAGISETYADAAGDVTAETFNIEVAETGDLTVTEASESPEANIIEADSDNDTDDVTLLVIELEADDQDIEVTDLPVGLTSSGAGVGEIVKTVKLMHGSDVLDSVSISSTSATGRLALFEDIDLTIEDGDTETLTVVVDVNDFDAAFGAGDSVYATTTGSHGDWDVEDAEGESVTPSGSVTGEAQSFLEDGINITPVSVDADITDESETYPNARGVFTIVFDVTAFGADAYIGSSTGDESGTYGVESDIIGSAFTGTSTYSLSSTGDDEGASYLVREGDTERFTLQVVLLNGEDASGSFGIELDTIRFNSTSSPMIGDYTAVTSGLDDIETAKIILQ